MYRIMLGEEDMPTKKLNNNNRYIYKVTAKAINFVNQDKNKINGKQSTNKTNCRSSNR